MPKQIEDIIPGDNRRTIRDIPIPESRKKPINLIENDLVPPVKNQYREPLESFPPEPVRPQSNISEPVITSDILPLTPKPAKETEVPRIVVPPHLDFSPIKTKRKFPNKKILIALGILVLVGGLGIFSLFSGATITYTPKSADITFSNETYTATKEGKPGDLLFSIIKISDEKNAEAPSSGTEEVSQKSSGVIVVYNDSGTAAQRLIKNTRFQTPDGKVYRIQNDITVPGRKTVGGVTSPGSLEITVYADQPGESYNIGLSDFTLPGLSGDPKFKTIYARSKTPMTGGMIGTVNKVSDEDKATAQKTIENELQSALITEAQAQVPVDFVLLPNLTSITYESLPSTTTEDGKTLVNERGNLSGLIFKKADLVHYLATKKTTVSPSEGVDADLTKLDVNFSDPLTTPLDQLESASLKFNGTTKLLWITNEDELRAQVAGKAKGVLTQILGKNPSIVSADAVIRPFWKTSFPDDASKIKVINKLK